MVTPSQVLAIQCHNLFRATQVRILARLGRDYRSGDFQRLANQSSTDRQCYYCVDYVFGVERHLSHEAGLALIESRHTVIFAILISTIRMKELIAAESMRNLVKFLVSPTVCLKNVPPVQPKYLHHSGIRANSQQMLHFCRSSSPP